MSKKSIAPTPRQAGREVPLGSIAIIQRADFDGSSEKYGDQLAGEELALAIDFYQRLCYRRKSDERKAFLDPKDIAAKLHGLKDVLRSRWFPEFESEAQECLAETVEYLAVRVEQAAETPAHRLARYVVVMDDAKARKAVV